MRPTVALLALLLVPTAYGSVGLTPPAAAAEDNAAEGKAAKDEAPPLVTTVDEANAVAADARHVRLRLHHETGADVLAALASRIPSITELDISSPGNKIQHRSLELLESFPKLRKLTLTGDPFLYDKDFTALGRLEGLRWLRMALP